LYSIILDVDETAGVEHADGADALLRKPVAERGGVAEPPIDVVCLHA
jgi:hypothetical protein